MRPVDTRDYRPDIDGLRALAVLGVVAYHAFPSSLSGGYVGVDVFFVISGFLITSIILRGVEAGRFSFVEFYARRVRRIFPALVVVLAFCFLVGWFQLWTGEFRVLGRHILAAVGFVSNFVLYRESGYFDVRAETKPLLHLWSLGIEEQFYLVWPFLVWAAFRLRQRVVPLMVLVLVASFALNVWWVTRDRSAAFFLPYPRFWELMTGSLLAYAVAHRNVPAIGRFADLACGAGLAAIAAAMLLLRPESAFPGWWVLLPTLGTALVVASGGDGWLGRRVLGNGAVVLVGLISYPLYLWHWPILVFLRLSRVEPLGIGLRLAAVGASFGLAWLTYRSVELPIRSARPRRLAPLLLGVFAVLGLTGYALRESDGIPTRFPSAVRGLDENALMSESVAREWRRHRCMLENEASFAAECVDAEPAQAPLVVLWGDSHAAALYPGLRDAQSRLGFRIAQFTVSRCPPIIGFVSAHPRLYNPHCVGTNRAAFARIASLKPAMVFMTAWWDVYDPTLLRPTLDSLRAVGVQRIVLVGDVPVWTTNPKRTLFQLYRMNGRTVPIRASRRYFAVPRGSDSTIASTARAASVDFVSVSSFLCDAETCMSYTPAGVAYSNADHLAPRAARLVTDSLLVKYLAELRPATASR